MSYNLGKLIKDLEGLRQDKEIRIEEDILATSFSSYRGYYDELALGYADIKCSNPVPVVRCVRDLLKKAKYALNKEYCGYKGGTFIMTEGTPIHIANYGDCCFHHPKYESGMLYTDSYEPEKKDSKDNYMTYDDVDLIGIEDKGSYYQLKLEIV